MKRYRKLPVVIEAVQLTKNNMTEVERMIQDDGQIATKGAFSGILIIETLEGDMHANIGDWIIKGVNGEYYPCKDEIFQKTYELVEGS